MPFRELDPTPPPAPWLTLGRGFDVSLALLRDPTREVYVAYDGDAFRGFLILSLKGALSGYIQTVAVTAERKRGWFAM